MRKSSRHEGNRWLEQAEIDLDTAYYNLKGSRYYLVCFLAQQSAEKALKAFLYYQGEEVVLGHSVAQLCERSSKYDKEFDELRKEISSLDGFYILTRYPNGLPDGIPAKIYNKKDAESSLKMVEAAIKLVKSKVVR